MREQLRQKYGSALAAIATMFLTAGCATTDSGTLEPVWGPFSERQPVPVLQIDATISGPGGNISLTTPDGVTCSGTWSRQAGGQPLFSESSVTGGKGLEFYRAWSTYTGSSNLATATATCSDGSRFSAEFLAVRGSPGVGIAGDSNGNVYRITF